MPGNVSPTLPQVDAAARPTLTRAQLDQSLTRLYEQPLEHRKKRQKEYEEDLEASFKKATALPRITGQLSASERQLVDGLYSQSMQRKALKMEQLEQKYLVQPSKVVKKSESEREEVMERLYAQSLVHKEQAMKEAEIRAYGKAAGPKSLSKEQLEETVAKLYAQSVEHKKEVQAKMEEEHAFKPPAAKRVPQAELDAIVERLRTKG